MNYPPLSKKVLSRWSKLRGYKIFQLNGLPGSANGSSGGESGNMNTAPKNLAEQVVDSALQYRAQAPLLDSLLKEVGISGLNSNGIAQNLLLNKSEIKYHEKTSQLHSKKNKNDEVKTEVKA